MSMSRIPVTSIGGGVSKLSHSAASTSSSSAKGKQRIREAQADKSPRLTCRLLGILTNSGVLDTQTKDILAKQSKRIAYTLLQHPIYKVTTLVKSLGLPKMPENPTDIHFYLARKHLNSSNAAIRDSKVAKELSHTLNIRLTRTDKQLAPINDSLKALKIPKIEVPYLYKINQAKRHLEHLKALFTKSDQNNAKVKEQVQHIQRAEQLLIKLGAMTEEEVENLFRNTGIVIPQEHSIYTYLDSQDTNGDAPLIVALKNNDSPTAKALIEAGADVNSTEALNCLGKPLHRAVQNGHTDIVKDLIKAGANVNSQTRWGKTPLYLAARRGNTDIVKDLINAGADLHTPIYNDSTPLHNATRGHTEILQLLLAKGADVNKADHLGGTPLHYAAKAIRELTETVQTLIAAKAEVNKACQWGYTPLHQAVSQGHTEVVQALIDAGTNVNRPVNIGDTPLLLAVQKGHTEVVQALIDAGANVNRPESNGNTLLHLAAQKGHNEIVQLLLLANANVNAKDFRDRTPLQLAAQKGHNEIVDLIKAQQPPCCTIS